MTGNLLETANLTYSFSKKEPVLNAINLQVPEGSIYGFLGPNGAGKTTTLRLILGLLRMQRGTVSIFGKSFHENSLSALRKIGSLIENPSVYSHLTAAENLRVLQKIYRCRHERIDEVLEIMGLVNTGHKKAGQFSLGMKQRLGIAMALLHNPSLLILDEPTNGLDPNSIIEVRDLLKKLNHEQGITILLSSHLLSEIEKLVTHVGIIHKGTILFQGTLDALKSRRNSSSAIVFSTSDNQRTQKILDENNVASFVENDKVVLSVVPNEQIARINSLLVENAISVYEIRAIKNDLETIFMDFINQ